MGGDLRIREAGPADRDAVLAVERKAFGRDMEADLVAALLDDPTARPMVSLIAEIGGKPVGHALFTSARLNGGDAIAFMSILAPLAVVPDAQGEGVGGRLVEEGIRRVDEAHAAVVLVLGEPDYYRRFGFEPAIPHGIEPPYPIAKAHEDAWMGRELVIGALGGFRGTLICADALMDPALWRE